MLIVIILGSIIFISTYIYLLLWLHNIQNPTWHVVYIISYIYILLMFFLLQILNYFNQNMNINYVHFPLRIITLAFIPIALLFIIENEENHMSTQHSFGKEIFILFTVIYCIIYFLLLFSIFYKNMMTLL